MILIVKNLRTKARNAGKQINPKAIKVLDKHIDNLVGELIKKQTAKRITEENIEL